MVIVLIYFNINFVIFFLLSWYGDIPGNYLPAKDTTFLMSHSA